MARACPELVSVSQQNVSPAATMRLMKAQIPGQSSAVASLISMIQECRIRASSR
jgi:hypothetical protein